MFDLGDHVGLDSLGRLVQEAVAIGNHRGPSAQRSRHLVARPPRRGDRHTGHQPGSSRAPLDRHAPRSSPRLGAGERRGELGYDVDLAKTDLLASLDSETVDEDEIDQLWSAETQRRAAMLESGDAGTLTWDDIQQRFAERRAQRGA